MPPPPPPPPPPPQPPLLRPPQSSVTSEVESGEESDSQPSVKKQKVNEEDVEESDSKPSDVEESDSESSDSEESDSEPTVNEKVVEESSDFESEEPVSPPSDESCDSVSLEDLIEELYTPVHSDEEKKDRAFWDRYFQQVRESEGFDIKDYPGSCPLTTVFPMQYYLKHPNNVEMLKGYAAKALEQYNEKNGTKYEVKNILKLNGAGCKDFIFYITFTVTNGEKEYFQAKVVRRLNKSLKFPIVRPRVKEGQDI